MPEDLEIIKETSIDDKNNKFDDKNDKSGDHSATLNSYHIKITSNGDNKNVQITTPRSSQKSGRKVHLKVRKTSVKGDDDKLSTHSKNSRVSSKKVIKSVNELFPESYENDDFLRSHRYGSRIRSKSSTNLFRPRFYNNFYRPRYLYNPTYSTYYNYDNDYTTSVSVTRKPVETFSRPVGIVEKKVETKLEDLSTEGDETSIVNGRHLVKDNIKRYQTNISINNKNNL